MGGREFRESARVSGKVTIVVRDAKEPNKVLKTVEIDNVVTDGGLQVIRDRVANPWSVRYWCLALGTGTGTPARTDTALFAEIPATRKAGSIYLPAYNQLQYYVRYLPEEANGYTYTELGVFENTNPDLTGGTLFNHLLITPSISKTPDILVDFYVTITFG